MVKIAHELSNAAMNKNMERVNQIESALKKLASASINIAECDKIFIYIAKFKDAVGADEIAWEALRCASHALTEDDIDNWWCHPQFREYLSTAKAEAQARIEADAKEKIINEVIASLGL